MSNDPVSAKAMRSLAAVDGGEICAAMVQGAPDALYFSDRAGICRFANPQCANVLSVELGDLIGRSAAQCFPPQAACVALKQSEDVAGDGMERGCEITLGEGEEKTYWISHSAVRDVDGGILGVVGRMRDLSAVKRLEKEIVEASEREMRRIACDLHDELCQELAAASLIARLLQKRLAGEDEAQAKVAAHIADLTRQMATKTRGLVYKLAPEPLCGEAFVTALRDIAASLCSAFPVKCGIEGGWPGGLRDEACAIQLFRIAHEAMYNAARHSGGKCITVRLRSAAEFFALSVADNGSGIAPDGSQGSGLGLSSMRYRAGLIRGELVIQSAPDTGTCVTCKVALA